MTRDQFDRAAELDTKIQKYSNLISEIRNGISSKEYAGKCAKEAFEKKPDYYCQSKVGWLSSHFFILRLKKKKVALMPHYEFAREIEMDADPELIEMILGYLEDKKSACEKEFEQIGEGR